MFCRHPAAHVGLSVALCLALPSCGKKVDLPRDFCQSQGRTLSERERKVSALTFYISSPFAEKAWPNSIELKALLPRGDPKVIAEGYLAANPSCCSVDEPWVMKNGRLPNDLSETLYDANTQNFEWLYDVNIKFIDKRGFLRKADIATDPCGSFSKSNHG